MQNVGKNSSISTALIDAIDTAQTQAARPDHRASDRRADDVLEIRPVRIESGNPTLPLTAAPSLKPSEQAESHRPAACANTGIDRLQMLPFDALETLANALRPIDVVHTASTSKTLRANLAPIVPILHEHVRVERSERIKACLTDSVARLVNATIDPSINPDYAQNNFLFWMGGPAETIVEREIGMQTILTPHLDHPEARKQAYINSRTLADAYLRTSRPIDALAIVRHATECGHAHEDFLVQELQLLEARAHLANGDALAAVAILTGRVFRSGFCTTEHALLTAIAAVLQGATVAETMRSLNNLMTDTAYDFQGEFVMAEFCAFCGDADSALRFIEVAASSPDAYVHCSIAALLQSPLCNNSSGDRHWQSVATHLAALSQRVTTAQVLGARDELRIAGVSAEDFDAIPFVLDLLARP